MITKLFTSKPVAKFSISPNFKCICYTKLCSILYTGYFASRVNNCLMGQLSLGFHLGIVFRWTPRPSITYVRSPLSNPGPLSYNQNNKTHFLPESVTWRFLKANVASVQM